MSGQTEKMVSKYAPFIGQLHSRLVLLDNDLELVEKGWTFHFAVDFCELYAFAFPLSRQRPGHLHPLPAERSLDTFARERVTLSFILAKWKDKVLTPSTSLVLLPPYIRELQTSLAVIKHGLVDVLSLTWVLQGIREATLSADRFVGSGVRDIVSRFAATGQALNHYERQILASFIKETYGNLVSLLVAPTTAGGLSVIRESLSDGTIMSISRYFKGICDDQQWRSLDLDHIILDNVVNTESLEWAKRLANRPGRENLSIANHVDAVACVILKNVNERLGGHKGIMPLITHSKAMKKTVGNIKIQNGSSVKTIPGVRDLDYFWAYFVCKQATTTETRRLVREILDLLAHFLYVRDWIDAEDNDPSRIALEEASHILSLVETRLNHFSNLSLGAQTDREVQKLLDKVSASVRPDFWASAQRVKQIMSAMSEEETVRLLIHRSHLIKKEIEQLERESRIAGR